MRFLSHNKHKMQCMSKCPAIGLLIARSTCLGMQKLIENDMVKNDLFTGKKFIAYESGHMKILCFKLNDTCNTVQA
jgi:hypothetical protein